ncbi:META domain-containing protein [Cloacibacterium caeni]|uniref:META domain-containing protein n=1 Tax=Cloacibacterium caeni TaxID=2004710 RepID=UPI001BCD1CE9|nr:META domain-containing protein [Cloacibacterium caeni]
MKTRFFIISLLSISFFMMSFAPQKEVSSLKRKWMLVEFQGFTKEELIQKKAYLDLTHLDKGGGAKMGCNSIFFSVKLKNNHRINFSGVGSTMMYCDGNVKLEENFGKLLPTITKYQVKGHFLTLKNKNGQTMKFVAEDWD